MRHWLMKSEPGVYSITDLERDGQTTWEGVRNYQARNFMRDDMKPGDLVLFYHSNGEPSGVAGLARVAAPAAPDPTQFNKKSEFYDAGSTRAAPRWLMVTLEFVERFAEVLPLDALKKDRSLAKLLVLQRGQRLSVMPVEPKHFERVISIARG